MNSESENIVVTEIKNHRLVAFIVASIMVAIVLVLVALTLYATSGTEQLDLSRPGYEKIREQTEAPKEPESFPANGLIDKASLDEFEQLYDKQLKQITSVNVFADDILSPTVLRIDPAHATATGQ